VQSARFNAYVLQEILKQGEFSSGIIITFQVMAVARVSPGDPHPVRTVSEGGQQEFRAHSGGTGNPDDPDIWRVLESADAGKIGRTIAAPIAEEGRNFWLPVIHFYLLRS
jgi:hypothetical protein